MPHLLQDLRFALRLLRDRPGFALTSVLLLGLGLGATTGVFGLLDGLLLRPPRGVEDGDRLVMIGRTQDGEGFDSVSWPYYRELVDHSEALSQIAAWSSSSMSLTTAEGSEKREVSLVSPNFFSALGLRAAAGRLFSPTDTTTRTEPVVVVSEPLAAGLFGTAREAVGRELVVNGRSLTILGVAPAEFPGIDRLSRVDAWIPTHLQTAVLPVGVDLLTSRGSVWLQMFGRLAPGATVENAAEELDVLARNLREAWPEDHGGMGLAVVEGLGFGPESRAEVLRFHALTMLLGLAILLIACANVSGLLLVRGVERRREMAMRRALGAGRGRLIAQLLTESLVLVGLGAVAALIAVQWTGDVFRFVAASVFGAEAAAIPLETSLSGSVLSVGLGLMLLSALALGLVPALLTSRVPVLAALRDALPGSTGSGRFRDVLVVGQLAVSLVLLVVCGLFVRSLGALGRVDPGFDSDRVLVGGVDLGTDRTPEAIRLLVGRLLAEVEAVPGVERASLGMPVPLAGSRWSTSVSVAGLEPPAGSDGFDVDFRTVTPGYLETMGLELRRGRFLTAEDGPEAPPVIVVSEAMAERFWPDVDPVGQQIRVSSDEGETPRTVVGVVSDMKVLDLAEEPRLHFYRSLAQHAEGPVARHLILHVRSALGDPSALAPTVRSAVASADPSIPFSSVRTLEVQVRRSIGGIRVVAGLVGVFAAIAVVLSVVGLYGAVAHGVRQRTREIGIRMALGARREQVVGEVLGRGLGRVAIAVVLGLVLAAVAVRIVASDLYGVEAHDPVVFAGVPLLLVAVGAAALALPARRAAATDPAAALRHD